MRGGLFILAIATVLAGCAVSGRNSATQPSSKTPATQADDKTYWPLQRIAPETLPTTIPDNSVASPDALVWYAHGQDQLLQHNPFEAVDDFRHAVSYDPHSFDAWYALANAYVVANRQTTADSFAAFQHAAALRPDDLQVHLLLGREYGEAGNTDASLRELRLATLTSDYRAGAGGSATVDFLLAQLLEQQHYDSAALDEYMRLANRIETSTDGLPDDPDVGVLVSQPQILLWRIGELYEQHRQYADALTAYQAVALFQPSSFATSEKIVRMLLLLHRQDEATQAAADLVRKFRASGESLALLHDVFVQVGFDQEVKVLRRLQRENPTEPAIAYALADVLAGAGKIDDAADILATAHEHNPTDVETFRRLFGFYLDHDRSRDAARILVLQLAGQPDSMREYSDLFDKLIEPERGGSVRLADLQKLDVPRSAEAARLYLVARAAQLWQRDALARSSIDKAVKLTPPFAPAFRVEVQNIWDRQELSTEQKIAAGQALADSAKAAGNPALAAEVRGLCLLSQDKYPEALVALQESFSLGGSSPDLRLIYAAVLRQQGQTRECEQALWNLVTDRPLYEEAWDALHSFYLRLGHNDDALRALSAWLRADPGSGLARFYEAQVDIENGRTANGEERLTQLLSDRADDPRILRQIGAIFGELGEGEKFLSLVQNLREKQPANFTLVAILVQVYVQANQPELARSLLEQTRQNVANDPEMLYQVASLYHDIGRTGDWETILGQVLDKDPENVPASNDLGFAWADEGKNLDRAEELIRRAVTAEPDNQAFLDSLGWVLYKRGKFAAAADAFAQAIGPAALPDPEILDHFGDDLYRLGKLADAQKQWQRAIQELHARDTTGNGDDPALLDSLQKKFDEAHAGKPVDVAPLPK